MEVGGSCVAVGIGVGGSCVAVGGGDVGGEEQAPNVREKAVRRIINFHMVQPLLNLIYPVWQIKTAKTSILTAKRRQVRQKSGYLLAIRNL
jgi:hypothetical protein